MSADPLCRVVLCILLLVLLCRWVHRRRESFEFLQNLDPNAYSMLVVDANGNMQKIALSHMKDDLTALQAATSKVANDLQTLKQTTKDDISATNSSISQLSSKTTAEFQKVAYLNTNYVIFNRGNSRNGGYLQGSSDNWRVAYNGRKDDSKSFMQIQPTP